MSSVRTAHSTFGSDEGRPEALRPDEAEDDREGEHAEADRHARPVHPPEHLEGRQPREEQPRPAAPDLPALDQVEDREDEGQRERRIGQDRQGDVKREHRTVRAPPRSRGRIRQQEADHGRQDDDRDQKRAGRPLAVAQREREVGDAQHPAEEGDRAPERAVRDRRELARAVQQVGEMESEAARDEQRGRSRDDAPRPHERDDRADLGGEVERHGQPAQGMGSHSNGRVYQARRGRAA